MFPLPAPLANGLKILGKFLDDEMDEMERLQFGTRDQRPNPKLPDPNTTPILLPILIRAPYFKPSPTYRGLYSTRGGDPVSEDDTVESLLENMFYSAFCYLGEGRDGMRSATEHDEHSLVVAVTFRGRFLVIPRQLKIKDVIAGARWPRPQGAGARNIPVFRDLRRKPRARHDEIDGIELIMGTTMELYVIAEKNLEEL
jgi:hypothetical protein